jgi:hypothetical protein
MTSDSYSRSTTFARGLTPDPVLVTPFFSHEVALLLSSTDMFAIRAVFFLLAPDCNRYSAEVALSLRSEYPLIASALPIPLCTLFDAFVATLKAETPCLFARF